MSNDDIKNDDMEKISFFDTENDEEVELYLLEQTTLRGIKYLLVAEDNSDESEAYIFKEEKESEEDIIYTPVEDDNEYEALIKIFSELIEDADIISNS